MALEGTLDDMSLSDLFQIFQIGKKSGILLMNNSNECGVIYVRIGQVIDATVLDREQQRQQGTGEAAVLRMLQWSHASFVFAYDLAVEHRPSVIWHTSNWLVLEALRHKQGQQHQNQQLTLDTYVEPGPMIYSADIGMALDLDQWRILDYVTARISLAAIAKATRIAEEHMIQFAAELVATGMIQVAIPPRRTYPASPNTKRRLDEPSHTRAQYSVAPKITSHLLRAIQRRVHNL